jgi:protein-S-isoprenylcysteine O-methyltransferase Ste14
MLIIVFSDMKATSVRESGKEGEFQLTRKENRLAYAVFLPMIISFIYTVFLPLQFDTIWLYGGLIVFLFGIIFAIVTLQTFSSSPKDKVITKGLYRFTRNPMYISMILMQIGIGIACSSWLYLLLTLTLMILLHANSSAEERYCLYRYGETYQKYMNRTPRWIGIPKSKDGK